MKWFKVKMILNGRLILDNLSFQATNTKEVYALAEEYADQLHGKITGITISEMSKWEVQKWELNSNVHSS